MKKLLILALLTIGMVSCSTPELELEKTLIKVYAPDGIYEFKVLDSNDGYIFVEPELLTENHLKIKLNDLQFLYVKSSTYNGILYISYKDVEYEARHQAWISSTNE